MEVTKVDSTSTFQAAVILPTLLKLESCLQSSNNDHDVWFDEKDFRGQAKYNSFSWQPYSLPGQEQEVSKGILSWDVPISSQQDEDWCSPSAEPITSVQAGAPKGGFCVTWDGQYHSIPFRPNVASTALGACTDTAPTWSYEID